MIINFYLNIILVIPFPISNKEIVDENRDKKLEIIDVNIIVNNINNEEEVSAVINYNNYNPTSMMVYENKVFCKFFFLLIFLYNDFIIYR